MIGRRAVCFGLLIGCATRLAAQRGTDPRTPAAAHARHVPDTNSVIRGFVRDSAGRALDSIEVFVITSGRSTHTDDAGRYTLTNLIEGPTELRARRVGWTPTDTAFVLSARSNAAINFTLGSHLRALDTVRVTASQDGCAPRAFGGFACRRKAGVGVYRDSTEIAALRPEYIADMLEGIHGLRRNGRDVEADTRWRCLSMLVDGHPVMPIESGWYGSSWWIKNVVAIEFYEDANTAPEWYKIFAAGGDIGPHQGARCSLIVFWLRGAR
jgi:hypothetical protein